MIKITLTDQIPSGKNAMGVARTGRHYPKPRFVSWRAVASAEIMQQRLHLNKAHTFPLTGDLVLSVSYREVLPVPANGVRDLPGMQDALFHLLVYIGVIEDDGQIKGLTWQYPWRTDGPCVEMELRQS